MKCRLLIVLGFVVLLGCNHLGKPGDKKGAYTELKTTTASFNKTIHDFGALHEGETVGCFFVVTNTGKYPLVINNVEPGCGCTKVLFPTKPIQPGKDGEIEVRFDTRGFYGKQYKILRVDANINKKSKELVVSANVIN
ncbi:DUF1573 domain-containing protein [Plebeiibacterium marinum]|uniref:DUF1573 domain-containing protein n=1 Tax=Plebeiibacterium marinum TaxID=2992111 RepID=A0AAE3MFQ5_9BACT|nr:DUF1573 domain-containing protein [Plebeiobacterium marinum]MCW3806596.1 DUF1573 domain-containing protein [Plebeiobacterium marinum]